VRWVPQVPQTPWDLCRVVPSSDTKHPPPVPSWCPHACWGHRAVVAITMLAPRHNSPDPPLCQGLLQWEPADSHGNLPSGRDKCVSLPLPSGRKTLVTRAGVLPRLSVTYYPRVSVWPWHWGTASGCRCCPRLPGSIFLAAQPDLPPQDAPACMLSNPKCPTPRRAACSGAANK